MNASALGLASNHINYILGLVTSNRSYRLSFDANIWTNIGHASQFQENGSILCDLDAADTAYVTLYVDSGSKVVDWDTGSGNASSFSGGLIA